jgi:hypothetical protein
LDRLWPRYLPVVFEEKLPWQGEACWPSTSLCIWAPWTYCSFSVCGTHDLTPRRDRTLKDPVSWGPQILSSGCTGAEVPMWEPPSLKVPRSSSLYAHHMAQGELQMLECRRVDREEWAELIFPVPEMETQESSYLHPSLTPFSMPSKLWVERHGT